MNLAHLLERAALQDRARPAIFNGTQCVATHGQWTDRAARVGAHLRAAGLQPGYFVIFVILLPCSPAPAISPCCLKTKA